MFATDSTVEILLVDNNSANQKRIEHLLTEVKVRVSQIHSQAIKNISEFLKHNPSDILLVTLNKSGNIELDNLFKLQKLDTIAIPVVPILSQDFDASLLPENIDRYLTWEELSSDSLTKILYSARQRDWNNRERDIILQENAELSSQLLATKDLFRAIVDRTSTLIWMCDEFGNSTFFNQAWSRVLELRKDIISHNWMLNVHPQDLPRCQRQFARALAETRGFTIDYRLKNRDRQNRWISNYAVPQFDLSGKFQGLIGYCFDITSHKITEQQLIQRAASDRLLAQITQKIHASLELEQILQTTVVELSQFLAVEKIQIDRIDDSQLTLLFESQVNEQGSSCNVLEPQQVPQTQFQNNIARLSAGQIVKDRVNIANSSDIGSILLIPIICEQKLWGILAVEQYLTQQWTNEEIRLLRRTALELSVAIKQARLYQQLEKANRELEQLSTVDGLTKIANRRKFDRYITSEWARLVREQSPLSLILCDIDYFKPYNDTYGHQSGDRCLQQVAEAISRVIKRPADLVARYGGEEFAIVLPNTPLKGAVYLAQQVRWRIQALKIPHIASPIDLYLTLSLGVSCCIPQGNLDFGELIAAADRGLYQAKELGRNRVVECEIEQ